MFKGNLSSPRLFDVAGDQIRALRSRVLISDIASGMVDGLLLRMGNSVRTVDVKNGLARPVGFYDRFQTDEQAAMALQHPTDLRALSASGFATDLEFVADQFASELLLPAYILRPIIAQYKALNLKTVGEISTAFGASRTATAIRLVQSNKFHAMLVCHGQKGRRWFLRPPCVPDHWFPRDELDRESYAFETLYGSKVEQTHPRKIDADAWFDRRGAERYQILEHTFPLPNDESLTLLTFSDAEMMEEEDNSWSYRRRN